MKIPKNMTIPEVTREQHIKLIKSLDEQYEYIFLYDARVRVAIIHDTLHEYYDIVVCSLDGEWFSVDHVDKKIAFNAYLSASHAVASGYIEKTLDKDLGIIGVKRTNA